MQCVNCQKHIPEDSAFCPYCATKVEIKTIKEDLTFDTLESTDAQTANQESQTVPEKPKKKRSIVKIVLFILLGIGIVYFLGSIINAGINENKYQQIAFNQTDEATFRASCERVSYDELYRNPENYRGSNIKIHGEVFQVIENYDYEYGRSFDYYLISVTKGDWGLWTDHVAVFAEHRENNKIISDDIVTIYGVFTAEYTYSAVSGAAITVPSLLAGYIDID